MSLAEDIDLPAIFQAISSDADSLEAVKQLNETLCFGNSALSRTQEEAIATVIAVANRSRYGALTHGGFFRRHSGDRDLASQLLDDYSRADLDSPTRQMLDFAVSLTREPGSFTVQDVEGLRGAGFTQEQIVSIILITCLCNFMNRLASSFGVDVPPSYLRVMKSWLGGPAAHESWLFPPDDVQARKPPSDKLGLGASRSRGNSTSEDWHQQEQQEDGPDYDAGIKPDIDLRPSALDPPHTGEHLSGHGQDDAGQVSTAEEQDIPEQDLSHEDQQDVHESTITGVGQDTMPHASQEGEETAEESEDQGRPMETLPSLERYILECCTVSPSDSTTARDLYINYLRWCDDNGEHALLQRNFGMQLTQMEYRRVRRSGGRHWWQGIALKEQKRDEFIE